MRVLSGVRRSKGTLRTKLFLNMLVLTALLLFTIFVGLFFIGSLNSAQKDLHQSLDLQMEILAQDMDDYFENLAVMGVQLSEDMTALIEQYLGERQIALADLNNSEADIAAVQEALFEPLKQKLLQTNCSGTFVMLDATVNDRIEGAEHSRSGLYLQASGFEFSDTSMLLYRGNPEISKQHGVMPHRKWRMEFNTAAFPNYNDVISDAQFPLETAYRITDVFILPGTSEKAALLTVPLIGEDGTVYGICGYEISQSYFKMKHAQPTKLEHLACLLVTDENGIIDPSRSFSCGISGGYYLEPVGQLSYDPSVNSLTRFEGEHFSYVGVVQKMEFSEKNEEYLLAVMIPQSDYVRSVMQNIMQITIFIVFLLFFAVICCLFLSRKFLAPVLQGLKNLKSENLGEIEKINVSEIDDLFDFLAEKDKEHEEEKRLLTNQKQDAENKYAKAQTKIARLVDKKTDEIDPDSYNMFLRNLHTLTPREREVFDYYLEGKTAKEIHIIIGVNENTIKFHNKNIYSKLGVSSRKQLLQYATLMKQREEIKYQ